MENLKFFYNGIKTSGRVLHKGFFTLNERDLSLTFYADGYKDLPVEIRNTFKVRNDSDYSSDYIVQDQFEIAKNSPFYTVAIQAYLKAQEREIKRLDGRKIKTSGYGLDNITATIRACRGRIAAVELDKKGDVNGCGVQATKGID